MGNEVGGRRDGGGTLHYGHPRMPASERAKIFMPFDPLKGYRDELRRREALVAQRQGSLVPFEDDDLERQDLV